MKPKQNQTDFQEMPSDPVVKSNRVLIVVIICAALLIAATVALGSLGIALSLLYSGRLLAPASNTNQPANNNAPANTAPVTLQLSANAPTLGQAGAPITIVEYADFQCPFCEQFFKTVEQQLKAQYVDTGKAKFVFQDFPFLGPESFAAAEAAKCAGGQGKFWEYHDLLYNNQKVENSGGFSPTILKRFASQLKLNQKSFNTCLDTHAMRAAVDEELTAGENAGVSATPTVFINGQKIEGALPPSSYTKVIDKVIK